MWRPTISSDEIWHSALSHSAKGSHWKDHKYIRIENGRYIYDSNEGTIKETPEEHQRSLESYYQDWKKYKGSVASIHDNDPEYVKYRTQRKKEDDAEENPWLADKMEKLESAGKKIASIGKKAEPMVKKAASIGRKAGEAYVDAATTYGQYKRKQGDAYVKATKDAYEAAKPIVAEAAERRRKKRTRGGSSGKF